MKLRKTERTQQTAAFLLNAMGMAVLILLFYISWKQYYSNYVYYYRRGNYLYLLLFSVLLLIFNSVYGGFQLGYAKLSDIVFSQAIALFFSNLAVYVQVMLVNKHVLPVPGILVFFVIEVLAELLMNILIHKIYYSTFPARETIMVYDHEDQSVYKRILKYQYDSYEIKKMISYKELSGDLSVLNDFECILAVGLLPSEKEKLAKVCYQNGKSFYLVPDIYDVIVNNAKNVYLVDTPVFKANSFGPSQLEKIVKRLFDIVFALFFLLLLSPIMIICAVIIKLQDGGPVLYRQVRLTQFGRKFDIVKFRSMKVDAEKDGVARLAGEHDDRITSFGKFIRAVRFDELPQLINILKGDMSVVGPRPERPEIVEQIRKDIPEFDYRLCVKAGLTGYAQVYGKYNTKLQDKLLFDLIYIESYSLLMDLRIIFMTFKILFKKESTEGVEE